MRRAMTTAMAGTGISLADEAKDLGVDATAAARRRVGTQQERVAKSCRRAQRLRRVRGPARGKRGLANGVLQAGAFYGVDVIGMSDGALLKLRTETALAMIGPGRGRRCLTAELALCGEGVDPCVALHGKVVFRWASQAWKGCLEDAGVASAWQAAVQRRRGGKLAANQVKGPVAATARTLDFLG